MKNPRLIRTAPNGDLFVAESEPDRSGDSGTVKVFRGVDASGKAKQVSTFATGLKQPFGIAFYPLGPNPKWVYIGNTDSVVTFPYKNGDLKASGPSQVVVADAARRRAPARRRPLDARRRLLEGRAAHVRLRRLALERR